MNLITGIRKKIVDGLANNTSLAILSLLIALIVWFMISMSLNPSEPKTLDKIPLSIDTTGTSLRITVFLSTDVMFRKYRSRSREARPR